MWPTLVRLMNQCGKKLAVWLAIVLGLSIIAASVIAVVVAPMTFAARKDQFDSVITNTLVPMFTAIAATIVTHSVGHAVASALRPSQRP